MIAGYEKPVCTPMYCCAADKRSFIANSPCIRSGRGYQSDHYIFALSEGRSYTTHLPLVSGARTGNKSTLHQVFLPTHANNLVTHRDTLRIMCHCMWKPSIESIIMSKKFGVERSKLKIS